MQAQYGTRPGSLAQNATGTSSYYIQAGFLSHSSSAYSARSAGTHTEQVECCHEDAPVRCYELRFRCRTTQARLWMPATTSMFLAASTLSCSQVSSQTPPTITGPHSDLVCHQDDSILAEALTFSHGIAINCLTVLITVQECECQAGIAERHAHLLVDLSTHILSGGSAAGLETLLPPHQMQHQQSSSSGQASRWELTASRRPSAWWLTWG